MDFVVSKVAMSVCALLVVGVLGGLINGTTTIEEEHELSAVLDDLRELVERTGRTGAQGTIHWTVPSLSTGGEVSLQLTCRLLRASCEGHSAVERPSCPIHTWAWDGTMLNSTVIVELDRAAPALEAVSGQLLVLHPELVLAENDEVQMLFVSLGA